MIAQVRTAALWGLDVVPVTVEADVGSGLPRTTIVGLPDSTVKESQERLLSAFRHSGVDLPDGRITINLAPTDLRKVGSHYDLPVGVAITLAGGRVPKLRVQDLLFLGELALDGTLRPVAGVLAVARWARAQRLGGLVVPRENAPEAVAGGIPVWPVRNLGEVFRVLWEGHVPEPPALTAVLPSMDAPRVDLADIRGQDAPKRALEVAAAGGHNLLMVGPPGAGKTLLARGLAGLLPDLDDDAAVEATCIHSAAGLLRPGHGLLRRPPFRAPHHTISATALVGGGATPRPGEITLAHHGVLFLDELPEFRRDALEALRQPVEEAWVIVSRAKYSVRFPARTTFVAAMNPCPCGNQGETLRVCTCSENQIHNYRRRVSGPLLDRIDLQIQVLRVEARKLSRETRGEPSHTVAGRVAEARQRQLARQGKLNAYLGLSEVRARCRLDADALTTLENYIDGGGLSARAFHRVMKAARTIADLGGRERVNVGNLHEAIAYRELDRAVPRD